MVLSLRILYYFPFVILLLLNSFFVVVIWILNRIGKSIVFINRNIAIAGDYYGTLAKTDEKLDNFLAEIQTQKQIRKNRKVKK